MMDLGRNKRNLIMRQGPSRAECLSPTEIILLAQHDLSILVNLNSTRLRVRAFFSSVNWANLGCETETQGTLNLEKVKEAKQHGLSSWLVVAKAMRHEGHGWLQASVTGY